MAPSSNRIAANRANARRSTGPRSPEGKARSSQNARKHPFNPDSFAVVRIEDRAAIARLVADATATYQPINSQERSAVECIALAKHSMLRMYTLEAGFFTNCLDQAMEGPAKPFILERPEIVDGTDISIEQHRAYWIAFGFNRFTRQSNIAATFLRFQAQAERLHRRAVDDFHRLLKLRDVLPSEDYQDPNEPNIEPNPTPQPTENTAAPASQSANEPNFEPAPAPLTSVPPIPQATAGRPAHNSRPALVPPKRPTRRNRQAAKGSLKADK